MARYWLSLALWVTVSFLLGHGDSRILQRPRVDLPGDPPSIVFKGDMRSPNTIQKLGGFYPRDSESPLGLGRAPTPTELEQGSSLYFHHTGATARYTKYVSTTTSPKMAKRFASPFRFAQKETQEPGYIYRISADPKMVDVIRSLGSENMVPGYVEQAEHVVVGGVPFDQVEGWYEAKDIGPNELAKLQSGDKLKGTFFKPNEKFNPKYTPLRGSGAQPQLAGFGKRGRGVKARKTEPWKQYSGRKVQDYFEEFRVKVASNVKAPETVPEVVEETEVFVEADALGARDLIGALDVDIVREGLISPEIMDADVGVGGVELAESLKKAEILESEEATAAAELVDAAEVARVAAGGSVLFEISEVVEILA